MSSASRQIERRWGMRVPDPFSALWEAGLTQPGHAQSLNLTDTRWLSPEQILSLEVPASRIPGLVPFALTGRGDAWSWYREWQTDRGTAVVYCPHDLNTGEGYAPDFIGSVYRLLLEEFSSSWLVGRLADTPEQLGAVFRRYSAAVAPFMPAPWSQGLSAFAERPVVEIERDAYGVMTREEAQQIIRRDLAFGGLDQELRIDV
jgi:hypothetical protein